MKAVSTFSNGAFNSGVFEVRFEDGTGLYFWHLVQVLESTSQNPPPALLTLRAKQYATRNNLPFTPGLWDGSTEGLDPMTLLSLSQTATDKIEPSD